MKTLNVLFLTESQNADWGHAKDIVEGLRQHVTIVTTVIYSEKYLEIGSSGLKKLLSETIIQEHVDIVVVFMGITCILDPWFLSKISNMLGCKIVLIFTDAEHSFENHDKYYAQCADLSWLFAAPMEGFFNIHNFPTYAKQGFYLPKYQSTNVDKDISVSFIGGIYRADRKEYLDFLSKNGVDVFVAGYDSPRGEVDFLEKNSIISRSKIHLNFTKVQNKSKNINVRLHQQKGRPIEASLLNTFVLSESYSGLEMVFDQNDEIPTFEDKQDLLEKIKYYLVNTEQRDAATKKAHLKSLEYDSEIVAKEMLSKLASIKSKENHFIADKVFLEKYVAQRYYFFGFFLIHGKFYLALDELKAIFKLNYFQFNFLSYHLPRGLYRGFKRSI